MERFSIPSMVATVFPHQAPGLCDDLQLGMSRPGEIVTVDPLTAVAKTSWDCARFDRSAPAGPSCEQVPWVSQPKTPPKSETSLGWSGPTAGFPGITPRVPLRVFWVVPVASPPVQLAELMGPP